MLSNAYRVDETGRITHVDKVAPIAAPLVRIEDAHPIELDWALAHHLLVLGAEVEPDELEALAVSVWDEAGWAGPGMLRLGGHAALQGPWAVDPEVREALGTPADRPLAWAVLCPPSRGAAPRGAILDKDPWAHAFPAGMPIGVEYKVLLTLRRMARRLAGSLRIAGSGDVMTPDPDSAVGLAVYSPRWIAPDDLLAVLHPVFPAAIDSRDVPLSTPHRPTPREVERITAIAQSAEHLPDDVVRTIEESRRRAAGHPQVVDGYALVAPAGNRSELVLEVRRVPRPPQALRWEPWTKDAVFEYRLRWIPGGGTTESALAGLTRAARLERLRSTADIERAAGLVVDAVGGSVIDEDGFLVGLDGA